MAKRITVNLARVLPSELSEDSLLENPTVYFLMDEIGAMLCEREHEAAGGEMDSPRPHPIESHQVLAFASLVKGAHALLVEPPFLLNDSHALVSSNNPNNGSATHPHGNDLASRPLSSEPQLAANSIGSGKSHPNGGRNSNSGVSDGEGGRLSRAPSVTTSASGEQPR